MDLTALTMEDLYSEVADLARDQSIADHDTWNALVDEVVDGHVDLGELDEDDDVEAMKETLRHRFVSFREEIAEETGTLLDENEVKMVGDESEEI